MQIIDELLIKFNVLEHLQLFKDTGTYTDETIYEIQNISNVYINKTEFALLRKNIGKNIEKNKKSKPYKSSILNCIFSNVRNSIDSINRGDNKVFEDVRLYVNSLKNKSDNNSLTIHLHETRINRYDLIINVAKKVGDILFWNAVNMIVTKLDELIFGYYSPGIIDYTKPNILIFDKENYIVYKNGDVNNDDIVLYRFDRNDFISSTLTKTDIPSYITYTTNKYYHDKKKQLHRLYFVYMI